MNTYQKTGAFMARVGGTIIAVIGVLGPVYVVLSMALGRDVPEYPEDRWAGSIAWTILGLLLVLFSKPFGRLIGRGLD